MEPYQDPTIGCATESLRLLAETYKHIDSFKHMSTPGNSKMTVYSELMELKNTLDALKTALLKFISHLQRTIPNIVIQAIANALIEVLNTLLSIDHTITVDSWNATLLRVYQIDFVLAFQCHQLQEICLEHYQQPTALLCTNSSKEFWETYFAHQWFVPWPQFWERILQRGWAEPSEEKVIRHFLDFCADSYVSPYELCLFLKWFGQLELAFKNLIMTLKSGLLVGAIPASEANNLLKGKMSGSFLVRFSKTRPGCFAVTVGGDTSAPRHFLLNYLEPGKFSMQHSEMVYTSIHNFVQMQPRLKYPVTTRLINDLMADVPTLRASVEIHTPGMGRILDMRNSAGGNLVTSGSRAAPSAVHGGGGGGGFGFGAVNQQAANGQAANQQQNRLGDSRAIYDTEANNATGSGMRASNGFGVVGGTASGTAHKTQIPMGFGAPTSTSFSGATPLNMPSAARPISINPITRSGGSGTASPEISPSSTGSTASSASNPPMGFGAPRSSVSPSFGFGPSSSNISASAITPGGATTTAQNNNFQTFPSPTAQSSATAVPGFGPVPTASPSGFGPPRAPITANTTPNAPAGFAPIQRQPFGFGPPSSLTSQLPPTSSQFNIAQTMIPQSVVTGQTSQMSLPTQTPLAGFGPSTTANMPSHVEQGQMVHQQGSRSPLSQSPSERNAMFFPSLPHGSSLQPQSGQPPHGYRLVPHHQQPQGQMEDPLLQGTNNATQNGTAATSSSRGPSGQTSALRRSVSQQQHRMVGENPMGPSGTPMLKQTFVRRSTSTQLRSKARSAQNNDTQPEGTIPEKGIEIPDGPDLFDMDDLRSAAPLDICVICLDRERSTVFLECSHMVCCTECSGLVSTCPICRQTITRVIPVYRS